MVCGQGDAQGGAHTEFRIGPQGELSEGRETVKLSPFLWLRIIRLSKAEESGMKKYVRLYSASGVHSE